MKRLKIIPGEDNESKNFECPLCGYVDSNETYCSECGYDDDDDEYYSPSNPWDAPGMSISDFCDFPVGI